MEQEWMATAAVTDDRIPQETDTPDTNLEPEQTPPQIKGQGLASAAMMMVIITFISRIAGMVLIMVIASVFGSEGYVNSYWAAFTIPDLLYFLMAGGAARTAFVPVFTEYLTKGRTEEAWKIFSSIFWLLTILGGTIVLLGTVFAPQVAQVSAMGWLESKPDQVDLTIHLMRILFPAQLFLVLGGLLMGALNAQKHFLWPALGPVIYDLFMISGALAAGVAIRRGMPHVNALDMMVIAAVVGAFFGNMLVQVPPLIKRGAKLSFQINLRDEGVQRIIKLALPVILGLAISEINWVVVRIYATMCEEADAQSILAYANRLWKLPSGVFAAAIAIAMFPNLSEHYARGDRAKYIQDFSFALRNTLFLCLPMTFAFAAMATPITRMLYQRGNFSAETSPIVGQVLLWLSPGMLALAINYIFARAFYARQNTVTPVIAGIISFIVCIAVGWWATQGSGVIGLAIATSLSAVLNAGLLMYWLKRDVGLLDGTRIVRSTLRMIPGLIALSIICWFGANYLSKHFGVSGELAKMITVLAPLSLGGLAYIGLCGLFKAEELTSAWQLVTRRKKPASL